MISYKDALAQLSALGLRFRFFGRAEVKELANIINEGEQIRHCIYGSYKGGSALLVATDRRVLLVDKRPFFLNLEDIRYEMMNEVYFAGRLLNASLKLHSGSKVLEFTSISDARLRKFCTFTQDQITRSRQLEHMVKETRPAGSAWRPYSLLSHPRVSKYSGRLVARKLFGLQSEGS